MSASIWKPSSSIIPQADPNAQIKSEPFIATEGQTLFNLTQFTYTLGMGALSVFRNGVKLIAADINELNNSSFSISSCDAGDSVEAVGNTAIADPTEILADIIALRDEVSILAAETEAAAASITLPIAIGSGGTGGVTLAEAKVNLEIDQVANTSDLDKPISTDTQAALATKVFKSPNGKSMEVPVHTTLERDAIALDGYFGYNSDLAIFEGYQAGSWKGVGGGQMLGQADIKGISFNSNVIAEDILIPANTNAYAVGPIDLSNCEITFGDNSTWTIL